MIKMFKGDAVKFLDEESSLISILENEGWVKDGLQKRLEEETNAETKEEVSERDALMAKAIEMGLNPHHKTGIEKLKEMIAQGE